MLRDPAAAEDVAQEACAHVLSAIGSLRRPENFSVWFYRIVVNEAKQRFRTTGREHALVESLGSGASAAPKPRTTEERLDLWQAVDALTPALRVAIELRYSYELNSTEIAQVLGTSPVTVRWRLLTARRRLRTLLPAYEPQSEVTESTRRVFR